MTLEPGTVLAGRWEITAPIASGGMGTVHRAHDRRLDRPVAVKVLHTDEPTAAARFEREVATHAKLTHPDIVVLFDAGEHDGSPFLIMELVDGPSLADRLRDGPLPVADVRDVGRRISRALAYAHERGVIHRDVKPSNVLHDADGHARLADFGIVRLADAAGVTATGMAMGSAGYVAPEQLTRPGEVGPPADVYALGLVLLEAATGRRVFDGTPTNAAAARLERDPPVPDGLPTDLAELLRSMTARDPVQRPSAAHVAARLDGGDPPARDDRVATAVLPPTSDETTRVGATTAVPARRGHRVTDGRRPLWLAAAGLATAALVAVVLVTSTGDDAEDRTTISDTTADPEGRLDPDLAEAFDRLEAELRS